jgi:hypothetical protein
MTRYWVTFHAGGEVVRRGPVSGWEEAWRKWPFLPAQARLVAEDGAEVEVEVEAEVEAAPALPEPTPKPPAAPEAPPEGLTRGQLLWRERMARKGKDKGTA